MGVRTSWLIGLLLALLAGPGPSHAEEGTAAVVDLATSIGATPLSEELEGLGDLPFRLVDVPVDDLLDRGFGPWAVAAPARMELCAAPPTTPSELEAALAAIEAQLFELDYTGADAGLQQLAGSLCGCSRPVPLDLEARIHFLRGVVRFYSDDREAARDLFGLAAQWQPGIEWDTTFPPDAQQVFLQGLADAVTTPGIHFSLPDVGPPTRVYLDGRLVPPEGIRMSRARHVVQFDNGSGELRGAWIDPGASEGVDLLGSAQIWNALRSGPLGQGAAAAGLLLTGAGAQGHDKVLLVVDPTRAGGWWGDVETGVWSAVHLLDNPELRAARRHQAAGGAVIGAGAALAAVGTVVALTQRREALALRPEMESSAAMYDMLLEDYQGYRNGTGAGLGLAVAGGACVATGIALLARGAQLERRSDTSPQLGLLATPTGAWVSIQGRW